MLALLLQRRGFYPAALIYDYKAPSSSFSKPGKPRRKLDLKTKKPPKGGFLFLVPLFRNDDLANHPSLFVARDVADVDYRAGRIGCKNGHDFDIARR